MASRFPARPDGLPQLHAVLEWFFQLADEDGWPVPPDDRIALATAAGEIAANIIRHACANMPDAQVSFSVMRLATAVEAVFEDPGIEYIAQPAETPVPFPVRGMGLAVARCSLHGLDYDRIGDRNRWRLLREIVQYPPPRAPR